MKFSREFRAALIQEGYPQAWVESAVPYRALKKIIKKIQFELESLGLDSETFAAFRPAEARRGSGAGFKYDFDYDKTAFQPKLTLFIQDGKAVDATLSPDTKDYFQKLLVAKGTSVLPSTNNESSPTEDITAVQNSTVTRLEVALNFDSQFFKTIQDELEILEKIQVGEQTVLVNEIVALSDEITALAKPHKFHKTDMYSWRELFEIYLEANIFFSTHERDHGSRSRAAAAKQLQWFQSEVVRREIVSSFKCPTSHQALERFVNINITLLRNVSFLEINHTAINKILKKFDKRTHLGVARNMPKFINSEHTMSETMAKAVCSQISQDLVLKVRQLDGDYVCSVCFTVNWRPVRMRCQHLLCISCAVELQKKGKRLCPFCRRNVILQLDAGDIDKGLENELEKYFPKEVREKRIQVETERGKSLYGESYEHPANSKCLLM